MIKQTTTIHTREALYRELIQRYSAERSRLKDKLLLVATLRLCAFTLIAFSVYKAFVAGSGWLALSLLAIAAFLWLVRLSAGLTQRRTLNDNLLFINQNELDIIGGKPNQFDAGQSEKSSASYIDDLDIFGSGSLFQLLNRTGSGTGAIHLAALLKTPMIKGSDIIAQQHAIQGLAPQNDQRQNIVASALGINYRLTELDQLQQWVNEPAVVIHKRWLYYSRYVLAVLNIAAIAVYLYSGFQLPLAATVLISWLHVGSVAGHLKNETALLGKKQEMLNAYARILNGLQKVDAKGSEVLQQLQQQTLESNGQLNSLARLVNLLDQRLNMLVNILLNSILLYDIHCIIALEKWKEKNRDNLLHWIHNAGKIEALVSLGTYAFNHPENTYPAVSNEVCIEAKGLYNPLLEPATSVSNDISAGEFNKILLITGSNMSGKTTYLRTVGTNVLMAQCGLPVCAESFRFSPFYVFSSIRVSDSLQEQTSYFMAELKRLQFIINSMTSQQPALVLIDEILRGTNSEDKYKGSYQFVKQLLKYNCVTLFATHDLALSRLEEEYPEAVKNYCFESTIVDGELSFDYRMLPGVARNKNATFLMKKMGIIEPE